MILHLHNLCLCMKEKSNDYKGKKGPKAVDFLNEIVSTIEHEVIPMLSPHYSSEKLQKIKFY